MEFRSGAASSCNRAISSRLLETNWELSAKPQEKISTKGAKGKRVIHEGAQRIRRRATKRLEEAQEGFAKGREGEKDLHEGR